ncbi:hypothetical protein ACFL2H_10875, partial [Planctomycetota bacterium]
GNIPTSEFFNLSRAPFTNGFTNQGQQICKLLTRLRTEAASGSATIVTKKRVAVGTRITIDTGTAQEVRTVTNSVSRNNMHTLTLDAATANLHAVKVADSIGSGDLWSRFRLDYGESVGQVDPRSDNDPPIQFRSDPQLRAAATSIAEKQSPGGAIGYSRGPTRFGEVEEAKLRTTVRSVQRTITSFTTRQRLDVPSRRRREAHYSVKLKITKLASRRRKHLTKRQHRLANRFITPSW